MGFGKSFLVGILAFIGINLLITIISYLLLGIGSGNFQTAFNFPLYMIDANPYAAIFAFLSGLMPFSSYYITLFTPLNPIYSNFPNIPFQFVNVGFDAWMIFENFFLSGGYIAVAIGIIIALTLTIMIAVLVGYLAKDTVTGFTVMFIIVMIGTILAAFSRYYIYLPDNLQEILFYTVGPAIITTIVNGLFYGSISALVGYRVEE